MEVEANHCPRCNSPDRQPDTTLCFECVKKLRALLVEIRTLVGELELQITRQSVGEKSVGGKSDEAPMMFDEKASEALDIMLATLAAWTEGHSEKLAWSSLSRAGKTIAICDWLIHNVVWLSRQDDAVTAYEEFEHLVRLSFFAIDRKVQKIPIGICDCGRPVHTTAARKTVSCACGQVYDVESSREKIRKQGEEQWVTADEAIALGEVRGRRFNKHTIRSWVRREKLVVRGLGTSGENLYRFGDLLALRSEVSNP